MYFSMIAPAEGREREAARQRANGPYADHQWLWRWFPAAAGMPRDFLFRRHETSDGLLRYYMVSHRPPVALDDAWALHCRDYEPELRAGDLLSFELRANPTVRHGRDGKSKRHDVVMDAKTQLLAQQGLQRWADWNGSERPDLHELIQRSCSDWLQRRSAVLGFELLSDVLIVETYQQHRERKDRSLRFTTVDFRGVLRVVDPQTFCQALFNGVGSAKSMGCGLLLVRRQSE
ncbi:type I-E CRISPR-associated protein Cas6/Cse3/CasE [Piscinibacter sp.]|uniref:type I-E CRISPR-associated protein Cas6/Cse3/CasE n=1 Tax=Piscinibacter sp. TaxID=1903157 RepID=UPI0039E4D6AC